MQLKQYLLSPICYLQRRSVYVSFFPGQWLIFEKNSAVERPSRLHLPYWHNPLEQQHIKLSNAFIASIQQTTFPRQPVTLRMGQQTRGYVNSRMLEHKHVIANFNP